jgi:hypothetical protein
VPDAVSAGRVSRAVSANGALPVLTYKQKVEDYVTSVMLHEVGHTLGLGHNFKGSLASPANSVMDYSADDDKSFRATPGPYDIAAIRYLYGLSTTLPQEPFCSDIEMLRDPDCNTFDDTSDPLNLFHGPRYHEQLDAALTGDGELPDDVTLNGLLRYVRAGKSASIRVHAWDLALVGIRAPIPAEVLASAPGYGAVADAMFSKLIQRLYVDGWELRGTITQDPPGDPLLLAAILEQLRANLLNVDGVRSYPTRRLIVDVLKQIQADEAYAVLEEARDALAAARPGLSGKELRAADDLAARIELAVSPYFL